jgi:putative sigma-54 modulation protein
MSINIQARSFRLTAALRGYVHAKLEKTLSRYRQQAPKISVTLQDINGPRGGEDMQCKIVIKTDGNRTLVIQEIAEDMYDAIAIASSRASWAISRQFDRLQDRKRKAVNLYDTPEFSDEVLGNVDGFIGYHEEVENYRMAV